MSSLEIKEEEEEQIPKRMKRLVVMSPGKDVASCEIAVQEVPVPQLQKPHQVLIKVAAAAINPSDYGTWIRCRPDQCPYAMGKEGCGVVVKVASDMVSKLTTYRCSVGTKVGFIGLTNKQGAYSEYVVADAVSQVFPLPADMPVQDAASFFVNPYTALAILDTVKKSHGGSAFVHTAAASQLGQMIVKLAPEEGVQVINVVRRQEQAELLKNLGAEHVIVSGNSNSGDAWKDQLKQKIKEMDATVAFDAVAGKTTGDLLDCLPYNGTAYVYGVLGGKMEHMDPMNLIYKGKQVKGFLVNNWISQGGPIQTLPRLMSAGRKVNAGLHHGGWSSSQFQDTTLEHVQADLVQLLKSTSTGVKLRVRFDTS